MFKNTRGLAMLSWAAIFTWPYVENIASRRHLFGTERDVVMAVAFCIIKMGGAELIFQRKKKVMTRQKKTTKKTTNSKHSVQLNPSGQRVVLLPSSGCSSVLLQHALDSLVGWFIIQMLGCVPAVQGRQEISYISCITSILLLYTRSTEKKNCQPIILIPKWNQLIIFGFLAVGESLSIQTEFTIKWAKVVKTTQTLQHCYQLYHNKQQSTSTKHHLNH